MAFIENYLIDNLKNKLVSDLSQLGKLYNAKKNQYDHKSVSHSLADEMIKEGWDDYTSPLKTKTKLRRLKSHSRQFEDDVWCQLYDLGYRCLNFSDDFKLPYGKSEKDKKQIDVIAVNEESILLVECKSSENLTKPPSLKTEFEGLRYRLAGFSKTLEQMFGRGRKVKYIFATRNYLIDRDSTDIRRLEATNSFFYDDNIFDYLNGLIKSYRKAAIYQFQAILFRGKQISNDPIEVPAIEGRMGGKRYYMFSLEPHLMLKLGFILHRTRANNLEMPTYQRLLIPNRLKGIEKFIDGGGYFPNSVIVNFSNHGKKQLEFQSASRNTDTKSKYGILRVPNAYAIAYIIDGQHRLYGYANSAYKDTSTIPVVAFHGLESYEQLQLFMDINQNQKAVSPSLKITLESDLSWNDPKLDRRIAALRSSIIQELGDDSSSPLYNKISIGEDKAILTMPPFDKALLQSGILPRARGNKFLNSGLNTSLYDVNNQNHMHEMEKTKLNVIKFISHCYQFLAESYPEEFERSKNPFIMSNRGTYAFICLIGSLNAYETKSGKLNISSKPDQRFIAIKPYLVALLSKIKKLTDEDRVALNVRYGSAADKAWLLHFHNYVHEAYSNYLPPELVDWKERQDQELQTKGRELATSIESLIKKKVIKTLKEIYGENWDLQISSIKQDCQRRATEEEAKIFKETKVRKDIEWTQMFFILDYKKIIETHWSKHPETSSTNFSSFQDTFSIDVGYGFNSKSEKIKWLSLFNTLRNNWAHQGTKESGVNQEELKQLQQIHQKLLESNN